MTVLATIAVGTLALSLGCWAPLRAPKPRSDFAMAPAVDCREEVETTTSLEMLARTIESCSRQIESSSRGADKEAARTLVQKATRVFQAWTARSESHARNRDTLSFIARVRDRPEQIESWLAYSPGFPHLAQHAAVCQETSVVEKHEWPRLEHGDFMNTQCNVASESRHIVKEALARDVRRAQDLAQTTLTELAESSCITHRGYLALTQPADYARTLADNVAQIAERATLDIAARQDKEPNPADVHRALKRWSKMRVSLPPKELRTREIKENLSTLGFRYIAHGFGEFYWEVVPGHDEAIGYARFELRRDGELVVQVSGEQLCRLYSVKLHEDRLFMLPDRSRLDERFCIVPCRYKRTR